MTLRHMKIFTVVCAENSITRAAEKLHMAQPAVSVAIKELEDYYGLNLFDRISKRLYLTDMGRNFLDYAIHITSLFDEMEHNIHQWTHSEKLKIGASIGVGTYLMPQFVREFCDLHPQSTVDIFIGSSDHVEKKILQNELDFAVIEGIVHSKNIICDTCMKDRLAVVCSPSDPLCTEASLTIEQLLSRPLLLREAGSGTRELFDYALASMEYASCAAWESTNAEALIRAAIKGLGVAVLPFMLVTDELKKGTLVELQVEKLYLDRTIHIIYHKNKHLTNLAKEFLVMCKNPINLLIS